MGIRRYTYTEKCCPRCKYVFSSDWWRIYSGGLYFIALPVLIIYWIIKYVIYGNPEMPSVGPTVINCPRCSLPIKTDKLAVMDLDPLELLTYRFKKWFNLGYGCTAMSMIMAAMSGLIIEAGISFPESLMIAIYIIMQMVAIVVGVVYRIKRAKCKKMLRGFGLPYF